MGGSGHREASEEVEEPVQRSVSRASNASSEPIDDPETLLSGGGAAKRAKGDRGDDAWEGVWEDLMEEMELSCRWDGLGRWTTAFTAW